MNHLSPYDYILGFASVTALVSIIDMIDTLKLFILILTAIGTLIKVIEQVKNSKETLLSVWKPIINIWNKLKTKK
jgi:hypothetical protein